MNPKNLALSEKDLSPLKKISVRDEMNCLKLFDEKIVDGTDSRQYRQVHIDTVDGLTFAVFRNADWQTKD